MDPLTSFTYRSHLNHPCYLSPFLASSICDPYNLDLGIDFLILSQILSQNQHTIQTHHNLCFVSIEENINKKNMIEQVREKMATIKKSSEEQQVLFLSLEAVDAKN